MSISVKFFASLRQIAGTQETTVSAADVATVAAVWEVACGGSKLPANSLAAVNMEYAGLQDTVSDGDEVAFFPPVTGGAQ